MLALLASGCGTGRSSTLATPELFEYADGVQARAAVEMMHLGPPCPRDAVFGGCSAVHRFVIDYGFVRDQVRAARQD